MYRIYVLALFIVLISFPSKSQVAKWLIPPSYDNIHMAIGERIVITDSLDKKIIWSQDGVRLASTDDMIYPFVDGLAVTTKRESGFITGFFDKKGTFTSLSGCAISNFGPYFSNKHLLVREGEFYRYVNNKGNLLPGKYEKAYPFKNGYATCRTFENIHKKKDPYNLLLTHDNISVTFSYEGKYFDKDDLEFISSVNDEDIGIVVAKHKLYYFNGKNKTLAPLYGQRYETNNGNQAKLENDLGACYSQESDSISVLIAKCGKNERVKIRFDSHLVPITISFVDGDYTYPVHSPQKPSYETPLRMVKEGDKYGISWGLDEILPPQLDEFITCFDDKAFVRYQGKCGMLQAIKDEAFKITINKGNPIDFRHQKYETVIRLDLPRKLSAYKTRVEVDPMSGCYVDLPSETKKDTEFGNYIQYNCVLNIPKSLPDEMYDDTRNEITYPIQIVYDGLKSPVIPFKVKAWHYKYFNVDVNDAETSIHQGVLSFTFNINAERNPGEAVYPTNVNVQTDSLYCDLEKISETRYKCKVMTLKDGNNIIVIQILEQGCPPASFPFEVTYTRPSSKTKSRSPIKENVVIRKKSKIITPTPHLDI